MRLIPRIILWTSVTHGVIVVVGLLSVRLIGEAHWLTGTLLFLPPFAWLCPLLVLAPLALRYARFALVAQILAVAMVAKGYLSFQWRNPGAPTTESLSILSNNTGERNARQLVALAKDVDPDLIALQDTLPGLVQELTQRLGERHTAHVGEFSLVSRFPIVRSGKVELPNVPAEPIAAWFEIDLGARRMIVYNVHFPTPRADFARLRGRGFRTELVRRGGIYSSAVRDQVTAAMSKRIQIATEFSEILTQTSLPFVAVGDFNAPSPGRVHRIMSARLKDFHTVVGQGFGLTFPGTTRNPLAGFGPWLRLDYIFASPGITPVATWVEPRGPAQHLALIGRFELTAAAN